MKKRLFIVVAAIMLFVGSLVFAACAGGTTPTPSNLTNATKTYPMSYQGVFALAEEAGFEGTIDELIAAIKGETGAPGEAGTGIATIEKTAQTDNVSTYTITLTNGNTFSFDLSDGKDGKDGVGILSVEKTKTEGKVDTYTITLTNGNTYDFTVTNGVDGSNGKDGKNGTDGLNGSNGKDGKDGVGIRSIQKTDSKDNVDTYTITLTDGTTYDFTVTNAVIEAAPIVPPEAPTDDSYFIFEEDEYGGYSVKARYIDMPARIVIPSVHEGKPVTSIAKGGFSRFSENFPCCYDEIVIPDSVVVIKEEAFYYCTTLRSVTIPEGVTKIGYSAFYSCKGLTEIDLPSTLTKIGNGAFSYCMGLTSLVIPEGVTELGEYAFSSCEGVTEITFPRSLATVAYGAFFWNLSLTTIHLPSEDTLACFTEAAFSVVPLLDYICIGDKTYLYTDEVLPEEGNYWTYDRLLRPVLLTDDELTNTARIWTVDRSVLDHNFNMIANHLLVIAKENRREAPYTDESAAIREDLLKYSAYLPQLSDDYNVTPQISVTLKGNTYEVTYYWDFPSSYLGVKPLSKTFTQEILPPEYKHWAGSYRDGKYGDVQLSLVDDKDENDTLDVIARALMNTIDKIKLDTSKQKFGAKALFSVEYNGYRYVLEFKSDVDLDKDATGALSLVLRNETKQQDLFGLYYRTGDLYFGYSSDGTMQYKHLENANLKSFAKKLLTHTGESLFEKEDEEEGDFITLIRSLGVGGDLAYIVRNLIHSGFDFYASQSEGVYVIDINAQQLFALVEGFVGNEKPLVLFKNILSAKTYNYLTDHNFDLSAKGLYGHFTIATVIDQNDLVKDFEVALNVAENLFFFNSREWDNRDWIHETCISISLKDVETDQTKTMSVEIPQETQNATDYSPLNVDLQGDLTIDSYDYYSERYQYLTASPDTYTYRFRLITDVNPFDLAHAKGSLTVKRSRGRTFDEYNFENYLTVTYDQQTRILAASGSIFHSPEVTDDTIVYRFDTYPVEDAKALFMAFLGLEENDWRGVQWDDVAGMIYTDDGYDPNLISAKALLGSELAQTLLKYCRKQLRAEATEDYSLFDKLLLFFGEEVSDKTASRLTQISHLVQKIMGLKDAVRSLKNEIEWDLKYSDMAPHVVIEGGYFSRILNLFGVDNPYYYDYIEFIVGKTSSLSVAWRNGTTTFPDVNIKIGESNSDKVVTFSQEQLDGASDLFAAPTYSLLTGQEYSYYPGTRLAEVTAGILNELGFEPFAELIGKLVFHIKY